MRILQSSIFALIAAAGLAAPAYAQSNDSELVVTGSRIVRNGYEAPTPTTVIGVADLQTQAPQNIADFVNKLPQFQGSTTPQTGTAISNGLNGANLLNLRGLGITRTLVLVDGRRVTPAAATGVVDVNLIPNALVSRVDVVTGGASAQWGSDALGGVVNFVLDRKFTGLKSEIEGGVDDKGQGKNSQVSLTAGGPVAGGRGHVLVSGRLARQDGIKQSGSRDWYKGTKLVVNPSWAAGNGQPYFLQVAPVGQSRATDGGLITAVAGGAPSSLVGTNFLDGGATQQFTFGKIVGGNLQIGGTYVPWGERTLVLAANNQKQLYFRGSYDVTDNTTAYVEAGYDLSFASQFGPPAPIATSNTFAVATIRQDNAFLPAATRAQMPVGSSFSLGRLNFDDGLVSRAENTRQTTSFAAGADGKLLGDFTWSLYGKLGETKVKNVIQYDPIRGNYPLALDAVVVTATNVGTSGLPIGSIACRSTLSFATNGCVPFNPFGPNGPSAAAKGFVTGTAWQDLTINQNLLSLSINGTAFKNWAGPVSVAAGADYREEKVHGTTDPLSLRSPFAFGNYRPIDGKYTVADAFAETEIPLLRDLPLIKALDLNAAVRLTHYSVSGSVTTWKIGANWDVTDDLRVRATRSHDIRAPSLSDFYLQGESRANTLSDPRNGGTAISIVSLTTGNPNLTPEIGESWGVGAVYRPSWFSGFSAAVDYYDIQVNGAISTVLAQNVVDFCARGQTFYCAYETRNAAGILTAVNTQPFNAAQETQKGLDIEVGYRADLTKIGFDGDLGLRFLANNVRERTTTPPGAPKRSILGEGANPAKWRFVGIGTYALGLSRTALTVNYLGEGVISNLYTQGGNTALLSIDNNHVPSFTTWDISETIDLKQWTDHNLELFAVINNFTDAQPPQASNSTNNSTTGVLGVHDLIGRRYRVGLRLSF